MGRKKKQESPKEQIYEIKSILKYEKRRGKDFYLVEWEGYPISEATWEPRSNFIDVGSEILDKLNALKESGDSEKKVEEIHKSLKNDKKSKPNQQYEKKKSSLKNSEEKRISPLFDESSKGAINEANKTSDLLEPSTQTKSLFIDSDTHFSNPKHQRSTDSVAVLEDSRPTSNKPESSMKRRKMNVKELVHDEEEPKNNMDLDEFSQPLDQGAAPHTSCLGETVPTHVGKSHKPKKNAATSLAKHSKEHLSRPKSGKNTKENIMASAFTGISALSSSSSSSSSSSVFPQKSASYMDSNDETPAIHESTTQESTTVKDKRDDHNHVDLDKSLKQLEGCNEVPTSIRVKSIRQDATHGLCGIISTTLSTGIVEESRMPISDVRVQYPDELIEFLLQRIQFRSVRPASLNANLPLPPVTTS